MVQQGLAPSSAQALAMSPSEAPAQRMQGTELGAAQTLKPKSLLSHGQQVYLHGFQVFPSLHSDESKLPCLRAGVSHCMESAVSITSDSMTGA